MPDRSSGEERRHFTRIPMDSIASIRCQNRSLPTRLLDISLKGALLEKPADYHGNSGDQCELELLLGDATITMQGSIAHSEAGHIGFRCDHIDLESISHLKRLVALNLGDDEALERELHELVVNS